MMRLDLADEQKERLYLFLSAMQKINGEIVDAVGPIAHKRNTLVICIVHITIIAVAGEFQHISGHPIILIPAPPFGRYGALFIIDARQPVCGKVPLAYITRSIARLIETLSQGFHAAERQRKAIDLAANLCGITACLQAGTRRAAHGLAGKGILITRSSRRQCVQIRRYIEPLAITAQSVPSLLVGKIKNNIWSLLHLSPLKIIYYAQ